MRSRSGWLSVSLVVCVVVFSAAYAVIALFRHWKFGSGYDLAIFDQAIWHLSRFERPASTVSGFASIFGDHFHPILVTLVPLYWIAPVPETLLIAQALLLGASIVPVYLFLRDRLSHRRSLALCLAYGSFWGMQRTALSDFHELAFAPLLVATALLALDRRRWTLFWSVSLLLCCVKEDLIPLVAGFGLYLMAKGERRRGALLATGSLLLFLLIVGVVIPWFAGGAWAYGGAFDHLAARPWTIPILLVTPIEKVRTIVYWLAPFAFLPLFSPVGALLLPIAAERLLSESPSHWGHGHHYTAPMAPLLAMAAGDALARLAARAAGSPARGRLIEALLGVSLIAALLVPGHQPLLRLFTARHYEPYAAREAASRALARVPPEASVVAQVSLLPHLSHRDELYLLDADAPDADIVIASASLDPWPNASREAMLALIADRRRRGYAVVWEDGDWIVLRRGAPEETR